MKISTIETCKEDKIFWKKQIDAEFEKDSFGWEEKMINIYPKVRYQKILGFGGALTESAGYAISKLPIQKRKDALFSYFSSGTLNYTLCRLAIASSDFSLNNYSYLEEPDMKGFSIERDKKYIIPIIQESLKINPNIRFLASPWSPPSFMKSNQNRNQGGFLLPEYKQLWADYLVRYVQEYQNLGIPISYMTVQNEPKAIQFWDSCIYTPSQEAELVRNYLFPTFQKNNIPMQFLIWDHNKERLFTRTLEVIEDTKTRECISGVAYHWYSGNHFENIELVHEHFPEMLLLATEGCTGYSHFKDNDEIPNAEIYAQDYIGNLNSGSNGQIDWNLFLDYNGGPNHKKNYCNSPIMVSKDEKDIIKNLSYYYIGHFSRYIKPGAIRVAYSKYTDKIKITTFQNPDKSIIMVVLNKTDEKQEYVVRMEEQLYFTSIKPHSIVTHIIRK